ncbi:MAG TPA: HAD-IA family hydrolase [Candidatus Limnocylindria bacterium]|nr:HAD-IA family hydrolase [Candidatus Limnocylindria bacterium]
MRRALLVDIDDTVVDWIGPAHDAVVTSIATHPSFAERDPSAVADRFMEIVEETHALWMAGELSVDQLRAERIRRLVRETGNEIDPDEALVLADAYRRAYLAARRPVAGAGELLAEVRRLGARVVAVTNNLVSEQEDKLRHTNLRHLFDDLVISEAAGVNKPDPVIFEIALRAAGAAPSEAVMLGDSWENDVVGALGMGIAAAWLDRRGLGVPDPNVPVLALSSLEPADEVAAALLAA